MVIINDDDDNDDDDDDDGAGAISNGLQLIHEPVSKQPNIDD